MPSIVDHIPTSVTDFLDAFQIADAAGSAGEALLAVALASGSADNRKRAKALLKKCKQPRLDAAIKALPRRSYHDSQKTLADDLETLAAMGDLDVPALAFHMHEIEWRTTKGAWPWCAPHVSEAYVRAEVQTALEKDPKQLHLERALPADLLYAVLAELPELELLAFEVAEPAPMVDLRHMKQLTGLHMHGPVQELPATCLEGVPLAGVHLKDTGVKDLSGLGTCTGLRWLSVREGDVSSVGDMPWPKLEKLQLRGLPGLTTLPSLGHLTEVTELAFEDSPITAVPDDIGDCSKLTSLTLSSLAISRLPESLGRLKLEKLAVMCIRLAELPRWEGSVPPGHVSRYDLEIDDPAPSAAACRFLHLPSTATLCAELVGYLDHACMTKGPRIRAALEALERGEDLDAAKLPELMLAVTRTYHDEEHGPSTNRFLATLVEKQGGPIVRQANELLPASEARSAATIHAHAQRLSSLQGFDASAYEAFATEAAGL